MIRRSIAERLLITLLFVGGCSASHTPSQPVDVPLSSTDDVVPKKTVEPREPLPITFKDLDIGLEPDTVYEKWMLPLRVEELTGKRIRIHGFISGAIFQLRNLHEFPLMREKECPYGPGGQAHHVIEVELKAGTTTEFTNEEICIEGVFSVQPYTGTNGKTWSLYRLEQAALCR